MVNCFSKSKFNFWNSHSLHLMWQIFQTIDFWPTFSTISLYHSFLPFDLQFYEKFYTLKIRCVLKNLGGHARMATQSLGKASIKILLSAKPNLKPENSMSEPHYHVHHTSSTSPSRNKKKNYGLSLWVYCLCFLEWGVLLQGSVSMCHSVETLRLHGFFTTSSPIMEALRFSSSLTNA